MKSVQNEEKHSDFINSLSSLSTFISPTRKDATQATHTRFYENFPWFQATIYLTKLKKSKHRE